MRKSLIQSNPNISGSIFLSVLTIIFMLVNVPIAWLITIVLASRQLFNAKKSNENKKFLMVGYIFMVAPLIFMVVNIILFVMYNLREAGV